MKSLETLMQKLAETEKRNEDLKSEVLALKRIQSEQSRALSKMVFENNYP